MIDSSPMYGRAEAVTGDLLAASNQRPKAFLATMVWTSGRDAGIAQMEQSFEAPAPGLWEAGQAVGRAR